MPDFLFLMHDDCVTQPDGWGEYLGKLKSAGHLEGGSAIGPGTCVKKSGPAPDLTSHLSGFIRIAAKSLAEAQDLLPGNSVFEAGGTVEIRELPETD